jgi:hypothetical protein
LQQVRPFARDPSFVGQGWPQYASIAPVELPGQSAEKNLKSSIKSVV